MSKKIRTIFIGTPDFGIPALEAIIKSNKFEIIAVITQPDKPKGRKQILTPPPVKEIALKNDIQVLQPKKINHDIETIQNLEPDIIIVAAYAQIISQAILDIPKYDCINIHGSLLPKYRGAACIQGAILDGESETGITIMKMDAGLDTGDIIKKFPISITKNDTTESVFNKLSNLGGEIIVPTLIEFIAGEINPEKQNEAEATYVKMIKKEDGKIDWNKSADKIERLVRAMYSWPGAYAQLKINNSELKIIKILEVSPEIIKSNDKKIGEIFVHNGKMAVQCGENALVIKRLQIAGKKAVTSEEFLRGYGDVVGNIFVS
jgi:methionyl-tRNA formyltransferase